MALEQGAIAAWQVPEAISRNFQAIIEQNFRRMRSEESRRLILALSDAELNDLVFCYNAAILNSGRTGVLLDIIVAQANAAVIDRVADHFGFEDVYAALYRSVPKDAFRLSRNLNPTRQRATVLSIAHAARYGGAVPAAGVAVVPPTIDYTIPEVYLSYRTAPVGSLSVGAALYETASFAGTRIAVAYGAGYTVGSIIVNLWATYSPSTYSATSNYLGQSIDGFCSSVQNLMNGSTLDSVAQSVRLAIGSLQSTLFGAFGPIGSGSIFYSRGGDFGVSSPWSAYESNSCK